MRGPTLPFECTRQLKAPVLLVASLHGVFNNKPYHFGECGMVSSYFVHEFTYMPLHHVKDKCHFLKIINFQILKDTFYDS